MKNVQRFFEEYSSKYYNDEEFDINEFKMEEV